MFKNLNLIFEKLCNKEDDSVEKVRAEMQKALDLAWENDDPKIKEYWKKYFPKGKPTLEKFLKKLVKIAKKQGI